MENSIAEKICFENRENLHLGTPRKKRRVVMEYLSFYQIMNLISMNYKNCEVWRASEYIWRTAGTRKSRKHLIAAKLIDILIDNGISPWEATIRVCVEADCSLKKKNLDLLGKPLLTGSIEEICNHTEIYQEKVWKIKVAGLFRNKIIILLED